MYLLKSLWIKRLLNAMNVNVNDFWLERGLKVLSEFVLLPGMPSHMWNVSWFVGCALKEGNVRHKPTRSKCTGY